MVFVSDFLYFVSYARKCADFVLLAFALRMRKLPRLSDVGCFPNCRSAFLQFWWRLCNHHGSDHFHIILESLNSTVGERPTRYKFDKADWPLYEQMCREKLQKEIIRDQQNVWVELIGVLNLLVYKPNTG
jgi:hypothetical protein